MPIATLGALSTVFLIHGCANCDGPRLALPHDDDEALTPRDSRIDEISGEHRVVLRRQRDHHGEVFRTLRLVDRRRIGGNERIEFAEGVFDLSAIEVGDQNAFCLIYPSNPSQVTIKHLTVIIILGLHHLVARGKGRPEAFDLLGHVWIEGFLEVAIERARAEDSPLHRAQHLHVLDWIETKAPGNSITDDLHLYRAAFRLLRLDKEGIGVFGASGPLRHLAPVDAVSVEDDSAFRRLPEHLRQSRNANCA